MEIFVQISGWIGMVLILGAYFLISRKMVDSQSYTYHLVNLFGAIGLIINTYYQEAWPVVALNTVWVAIAVSTLIKIRQNTSQDIAVKSPTE